VKVNAVIAVSVMAHPNRRRAAEDLLVQMEDIPARIVYDPDPFGPSGTMRTARLAWKPWHAEQTHHLVIQDDSLTRPGFVRDLRAIVDRHPGDWVTLACEWGCKTAWVCLAAAVAGKPFAAVVDSYTPVWGLVMPVRDAELLSQYLLTVEDGVPDDEAVEQFRGIRGIGPAIVTIPNLLEHGEEPSLIGNDDQRGHRRSAVSYLGDIPRTWWEGRELAPLEGAPVMIYRDPWHTFGLGRPGHWGFDTVSLHFDEGERNRVHELVEGQGLGLELATQRSIEGILLTVSKARRFAVGQGDLRGALTDQLARAAVESCVRGTIRTLSPALTEAMTSAVVRLAEGAEVESLTFTEGT
jgi:hypothetical protein